MKAFVELEGPLLLFVSLIWMCSGQKRVLVECSRLNFRAIAKRALFYQDELVGPDELLLGTGCQAIRVRPDELDFDYPLSLCGIATQCVAESCRYLSRDLENQNCLYTASQLYSMSANVTATHNLEVKTQDE
ncbi:putative oocyte-secreted protein 1 homolog [Pteropus vampyrus]|uniref:Oocyte-secreted protein 1 homolog n=1 Tax=Pteropus vampyrus TaxID=132908 RepID=A0A6P3RI66_PTEVA|nr:putative oocyte-secreted protein 1 homolog [Pteropus vampyrus]